MSPAARIQIDALLSMLENGAPGSEVIRTADRLTAYSEPIDRRLVMGVVQWHVVLGAKSKPTHAGLADEDSVTIPRHRVAGLTLTVVGAGRSITAESPRDVLNWRSKDFGPLVADAENVLQNIRNDISKLYRKDSNPRSDDIERKLLAIGSQVARLLPEPLLTYLRDGRASIIALEVAADYDFPLELCRVDRKGQPIFLCDTAEIVRWYRGAKAIYTKKTYSVRHIAFVVGHLNLGFDGEERAVLCDVAASEKTIKMHSRADVFTSVFARNDHQLLHYKGHIANDGAAFELSLQTGESIGLVEIGDNPAEHAFFENEPVIFLNGCDGALSSQLIGGKSSFPFRFAELGATAVIATLWEVSEGPATAFTSEFYGRLRRGTQVSQAVKLGREKLLETAQAFRKDGDNQSFMLYYLAAYAYVYYGPPDLALTFN